MVMKKANHGSVTSNPTKKWKSIFMASLNDFLLETGQERDLLLGLTWVRIEIIECFKSLYPSTDLCQTDFCCPLRAQGSPGVSRRDRCPLRDWSRKEFSLGANLG